MSIATGDSLAKQYGPQDVFANVSFQLAHGDHVALVGANGTGKTTLLRILAGLETPSAGRVSIARSVRIGYLSQKPDWSTPSASADANQRTVLEEMNTVFVDLHATEARLRQMEQEMAGPDHSPQLLERYGELMHQFELAGGYTYEQVIRQVLLGLGLTDVDMLKPLLQLSGGQRTRAQLAQLLLTKPDLLLLDEPINHLDLAATQWLEEYLKAWRGSFVVVAHDRYFLDQVANRVWEMNAGTLEQYSGNYSNYLLLSAERRARQLSEYEAQQEQIARTEEFIRRYKAGQRSKEARGRETRLARLERLERPQEQQVMKLALASKVRGGNNVLVLHKMTVGYDRPLLRFPDLVLRRRERAALLGPNGCGKTTFLKTVLGQVPPLQGESRLGPSVHVAYLSQGHESLDLNSTILDEILKAKNMPVEQARGFLGRYLFSGDDVFKPVGVLSGGERGRVALAILALQGANLLLLDEPTNQLDIQSQEMLEQVLQAYDGTILFVSHDRFFIDALATQVWAVDKGQVRAFEGNYSLYLQAIRQQQEVARSTTPARQRDEARRQAEAEQQRALREQRRKEQRRAELETLIHQLESRVAAISSGLEEASKAQRITDLYDLGREYADVQEELQQRLEEWASIDGA
ncbi:MAG TPA: ABC-F family ATP-binding cassette domain-containing protein [Anaerolineae bacterium]|nr:ABC-F family ATP-binding cassette domain-containing protein [Anaerolineae bacterium]